jgi:hypothetical protein
MKLIGKNVFVKNMLVYGPGVGHSCDVSISAKVTPAFKDEIKQFCEANGQTVSELIKQLLIEHLHERGGFDE